jgi:hypothetical protein
MDYRDEDRWLFQTRIRPTKDHPPVWFLAALLIGWFAAMIYAASTDLQDAENVVQEEQAAHEKKLELLSDPILWTATVTQCDPKYGCRTRFYTPKALD